MEDLSKSGSFFRPPFFNPLNALRWEYQQSVREFCKLLGLPASKNAAILSYMLSDLQKLTEAQLGIKVPQAVAVLPYLPKLLDIDLKEAFEHAGIKRLTGHKGLFDKKEKSPPYGGISAGHGICRSWEDRIKCAAEDKTMSGEQTLSITYTNESLQVERLLVYNAEHVVRSYSNSFSYLGSQPLELEKKKSELNKKEFEEHLNRLKNRRIRQIKSAGWGVGEKKFQRLALLGESAEDKDFLEAVWIALGDLESLGFLEGRSGDMYSAIQIPGFSALYTGARGAAELAIRWQEKRNATYIAVAKVQKPTSAPAPAACNIVQVAYGTQDSKRVVMDEPITRLNLDVNYVVNALWRMPPTDKHESWSMEIHDCRGRPRILYGIVQGLKYWAQIVHNSEFDSKVSWIDGTTSEEVAFSRIQDGMVRSRTQPIDHLIRTLNLNPHWLRYCVEKFQKDRLNKEWSIRTMTIPGITTELWLIIGETAEKISEPVGTFLQVEKVAWGEIKPNSEMVLVTVDAQSQEFGDALTTDLLQSQFRSHNTREESWEIWGRKADRGTLAPLWVFFDGKFAFERRRP